MNQMAKIEAGNHHRLDKATYSSQRAHNTYHAVNCVDGTSVIVHGGYILALIMSGSLKENLPTP
jgi:hypothetical protein